MSTSATDHPFDDTRLSSYKEAVNFSYLAHRGQFRKDSNIPYWVHVSLVSATVAEWGGDADQIEAALLHDTVEDTDTTIEVVRTLMGDAVADIVLGMTERKCDSTKWKERKLHYISQYLDDVDFRCYLPKLADIYSNLTSTINSVLRGGADTSVKKNTIEGYAALSAVCLCCLRRIESPATYRLVSQLMLEQFQRVERIIVPIIGPSPIISDFIEASLSDNLGLGEQWIMSLQKLWGIK